MWGRLEGVSGVDLEPPERLAALCEVKEYLGNGSEYVETRILLTEHIWGKEGGK